jgi:hypothetical protein
VEVQEEENLIERDEWKGGVKRQKERGEVWKERLGRGSEAPQPFWGDAYGRVFNERPLRWL